MRETPGRGWTAGQPGKRQTSSRGARVSSLLCAPRGAPLRRLSRPSGSAATGCGDPPALRPRAPPSPHSPGDTHRLQEAQGAHVVPLGAQDLVEDAQAEAQLALRLPGGRAQTGGRRPGAGGPGVRVGSVLSPVDAAIAAAGYLHSSAAASCRLLPPRGGRGERRLRGPSTPSRTGRAGSAAGRALGAAGGTGGGGPGLGAEAARGGWTRGGRRRPSGLPDGGPRHPPAQGASAKCHAALSRRDAPRRLAATSEARRDPVGAARGARAGGILRKGPPGG